MPRFIYLVTIFLLSTLWLLLLSFMAPSLSEFEEEPIRFPKSFNDISNLSVMFQAYNENNRFYMVTLFTSAYLYKQAFCIPGSAFLNVLAGAIFGLWISLPLCCVLTGIGATMSYMLSKTFAENIVTYYWPEEVGNLKRRIDSNRNSLIPYLLSLRLLPFTPNWLLNLISPVVGIPLHYFFVTAFVGLVPYNYICVQAGVMLSSFASFNDIFTGEAFLKLTLLALTALYAPKLIRRNLTTLVN